MSMYLIAGRLVAGGGFDAGQITLRQVVPDSTTVELTHNDAGSIDVSLNLPLVDRVTKVALDLPNELIPGRDFLGVVDGDTILECGPVWADPFKFPRSSKIIAGGLWTYFDHRYVLPPMAPGVEPRKVTSKWTGLSLGTIAKRIVQQACSWAGADLPIDYPADVAGDEEREYPGSDLVPVGTALANLTAVEGGPEITFRPKWGADRMHVRWDMLIGDLSQEGPDHYWDVSVPAPHATIGALDRDGRELAGRFYLSGATITNRIQDPSFEEMTEQYDEGANVTGLIVGQGSAFHGTRYGQWSSVAAGNAGINIRSRLQVEAGEVHNFSAYVRSVGSARQMRLLVGYYNGASESIIDEYSPAVTVSTTGWTRLSWSSTAPAGVTSMHLSVQGIATAAGQSFRADGLQLTEGSDLYEFTESSYQLQAVGSDPTLVDAGFPLLESSSARSSVLRLPTLQAYAGESVARAAGHIEQFEILAQRGKHPVLGTYWPGHYAKVRIGKNPRIPAGTYRVRIIRITVNATGDVQIQCASERVASGYPVPASNRSWLESRIRSLSVRIDEQKRGA